MHQQSLYALFHTPLQLHATIIIELTVCVFFYLVGRELSRVEQYGLVFLISLPLFILASAGSTVFWIIGELVVASK